MYLSSYVGRDVITARSYLAKYASVWIDSASRGQRAWAVNENLHWKEEVALVIRLITGSQADPPPESGFEDSVSPQGRADPRSCRSAFGDTPSACSHPGACVTRETANGS